MTAVIVVILLVGIFLLLWAAAAPDRRRGLGAAIDLADDPGPSIIYDVFGPSAPSHAPSVVLIDDDPPSYESSMDAGELHVEADETSGVSWWSSDDDSSSSDSDSDDGGWWDDD